MHKNLLRIYSIAAISILAAFIHQPSFALPSTAELENTIKESKEFSKDKKFTIGIRDNEVQINTYVSSSVDKDCKIEAVLLGKVLMSKHTDVSRVSVNFYSTSNSSSYKQISVTKPEIVAFGSGQVTDGELLSALKIEEKSTAQAAPAANHSTKEPEKSSDKGKEANAEKVGGAGASAWTTYHNSGLVFQYPPGWRISREMEGETLACFRKAENQKGMGSKIELKLYRSKNTQVVDEAREHAEHHQRSKGFQIIKPSAYETIGVGKSIKGICEYYSALNEDHERRYERLIYFGWPGYIYRIGYAAKSGEQGQVNALFNQLLSTLRVEAAPQRR